MSSDKKPIRAMMVIEILGRPPEHLTEALEKILEKLGEEKGIEIKEKKINETVLMKKPEGKEEENKQEFYTSFAEVEVEVEEVLQIAGLMFKYMPAHIEILSPENISLTNNNLNEVLNELARRLHGYDEVARIMQVEKKILENKLREIMGNEKGEK